MGVSVLSVISAEAAWGWMIQEYLGGVPACPRCGVEITGRRALVTFWNCDRTWCSSCHTRINPAEGTPICDTSWTPIEYLQLLILTATTATPIQIAAHLGKSSASIRDMIERIALCHLTASLNLLLSAPISSGIQRGRAAEGGGFQLLSIVAAVKNGNTKTGENS